MRAKRKKTFEGQQDEGAHMSNELESDGDRAMVMTRSSEVLESMVCTMVLDHCWFKLLVLVR
jgi:hypothetical protein